MPRVAQKPTIEEPLLSPNKGLELNDIDYSNLQGPAFKQYQEVIDDLILNDKYDFEMWLATSVRKFRVNEDNGDREEYIAGIQLNGNKPIQTTRIKVKDALELNKQVSHNQGDRGWSKYYLLKKP